MSEEKGNSLKQDDMRPKNKIVTFVAVLLAIVAGSAALFGDLEKSLSGVEKISSRLRVKCIEAEICDPGSFYMRTAIRVALPDSPHAQQILNAGERQLSEIIAKSTASQISGDKFNGTSIYTEGGPGGAGEYQGYPIQSAEKIGGMRLDTGDIGWRWGLPMLDLSVAEAGKTIDITDFMVAVDRSWIDETPYVQVVSSATNFGSIFLVNESVHQSVRTTIDFSYLGDSTACYNFRALEFDDLDHSLSDIEIETYEEIELSNVLKANFEEYEFLKYQFRFFSETREDGSEISAPPAGFLDWSIGLDSDATEPQEPRIVDSGVIYGKVNAVAKGQQYTSLFCAEVTINPPDATGGGSIENLTGSIIDLEVSEEPYTSLYDVSHRIDTDKPHFRTVLVFHSEKSAYFDLRLSLLSFGEIVYTSDPIRIHVFIPKTTASSYQINFAQYAKTPYSKR